MSNLDEVRAAWLPAPGLARLGMLRTRPGVQVTQAGDFAWVEWDAANSDAAAQLLAVPGVRLFVRREGRWYELGHALPLLEPLAQGDAVPLSVAIVPQGVQPTPAPVEVGKRARLYLVADPYPRPTRLMRTTVAALAQWAEWALTDDITAVRGIWRGEVAWLTSERLPGLPGERFWGETVFAPLGKRAEPDWPEEVLRQAAGLDGDEWLVITDAGAEALPGRAFAPLTRAGVRLAQGECR